jgi:3-phenylpropionate/trans-cinnamate dioxygenase ferredoxin subunit
MQPEAAAAVNISRQATFVFSHHECLISGSACYADAHQLAFYHRPSALEIRYKCKHCVNRLVFSVTGNDGEKNMADVKIKVLKNGPLLVEGSIQLFGGDGQSIPCPANGCALCRCGASTKKPFCDGTHSKIGFEAAESAVPGSKE